MMSTPLTDRLQNLEEVKEDDNDQINQSFNHQTRYIPRDRFKHLCTQLTRRLSITKDHSRSIESKTNAIRKFEWPDFEKLYDQIPTCLANALPGPDDSMLNNEKYYVRTTDVRIVTENDTNEQMKLFEQCKRGRFFRRNALCHKIDKIQYNGQLDTFIQQLMLEKLMRTWT